MLLFDNLGNVKDERHLLPRLNIVAAGVKTYLCLTGQGGTENGGLEGNLRQSGGQSPANAGGTENPQGGAAGEHLLSGYDWYNNDVARGEAPRLIQSSEQNQSSPQGTDRMETLHGADKLVKTLETAEALLKKGY